MWLLYRLSKSIYLNVPTMREKLRRVVRQGWIIEIIACESSGKWKTLGGIWIIKGGS